MIINIYERQDDCGKSYQLINFYEHQIVKFFAKLYENERTDLKIKLQIAEDCFKKININPRNKLDVRGILKLWAKKDPQISEYYKRQYPRGGVRAGAGRKVGSYNNGKKALTAFFGCRVTVDEKDFLKKQLELYRKGKIN